MAPKLWCLGLLWSPLPHIGEWYVSFGKEPWSPFSRLPFPSYSPRLDVLISPWCSHSWCHSVSVINLEKWEGREEGKNPRISLLLWALPRVPLPDWYLFLFQMQNSTECGKKDRQKTLTPFKAKVPGLSEREKKPVNSSFHLTCTAVSGDGAQRAHILVWGSRPLSEHCRSVTEASWVQMRGQPLCHHRA